MLCIEDVQGSGCMIKNGAIATPFLPGARSPPIRRECVQRRMRLAWQSGNEGVQAKSLGAVSG